MASVHGTADASADVFVEDSEAARYGEMFFGTTAVDNSTEAFADSITVRGVRTGVGAGGEDAIEEKTVDAFVAKDPEVFTYDADGNLTEDGRWTYSWNAMNRLVAMETRPEVVTAGADKIKLEFDYDSQGRRFEKKVFSWSGSTWVVDEHWYFVYDGWNLVAKLDGHNDLAVKQTYVWGLDLSTSMQGAGGVGGLLLVTYIPSGKNLYPQYDGNGNVVGLVDAASGNRTATYEYDPFGNVLREYGDDAALNPFRFSTKFADESDLLYYGHRYYSAGLGRWLSRDPIGERGGLNVYGMVQNNAVSLWDYLGFAPCKCGPDITNAFYSYLRSEIEFLSNIDASERGIVEGLITMSQIGNNIDFWYNGQIDGCATGECEGTVYFNGRCVRATAMNNILYGVVADALDILQADAVTGASVNNVVRANGIEGSEREGAYDIGYDLWDALSDDPSLENDELNEIVSDAFMRFPVVSFFPDNAFDEVAEDFEGCEPCGEEIQLDDVGRVGIGFRMRGGDVIHERGRGNGRNR